MHADRIYVYTKFEENGVVHGENDWVTKELEDHYAGQWDIMDKDDRKPYFEKESALRKMWKTYNREIIVYKSASPRKNIEKVASSKGLSEISDGNPFLGKFMKSNDGSRVKLSFSKKK